MDDMISRQEAIELLQKWSGGYEYIEMKTESAISEFQNLPAANLFGFTLEELMTAAVVVRMAGLTSDEFHELLAKACEEV